MKKGIVIIIFCIGFITLLISEFIKDIKENKNTGAIIQNENATECNRIIVYNTIKDKTDLTTSNVMKPKTNREKLNLLKNFLKSMEFEKVTITLDPDEQRKKIKFMIEGEI